MDLLNTAIIFFAIISLVSFSGLLCERSGVVNIALNAMMIFGSLFYAVVEKFMHKTNFESSIGTDVLATLVAMIASVGFSLIFGYAVIKLRANQIIAGTGMNIISLGFAILIISIVNIKTTGGGGAVLVSSYSTLNIVNGFNITYFILLLVGITAISFLGIALRKMKWGKWLVASGENPYALLASGVSPVKMRFIAVSIAGALTGFAGALYTLKNLSFSGDVNGIGYISLGILLVGQWRTIYVVLGALVFAFVYAEAGSLNTNKYQDLIKTIPYLLPLIVLPFFWKISNAPKYAGVPLALTS